MFCQLSESVNVNKNRGKPCTGLSSSDSKLTNPKRHIQTCSKKRSHRRNSLNKLLTYYTRAQNERYIKNLSSQALTNDEVKLLSRGLKFIQTPPVRSSNKRLLKDFDHFARTMRLKYVRKRAENFCPSLPCQINLATTHSKLGCSKNLLGRNQTRNCFSNFPPSNR